MTMDGLFVSVKTIIKGYMKDLTVIEGILVKGNIQKMSCFSAQIWIMDTRIYFGEEIQELSQMILEYSLLSGALNVHKF